MTIQQPAGGRSRDRAAAATGGNRHTPPLALIAVALLFGAGGGFLVGESLHSSLAASRPVCLHTADGVHAQHQHLQAAQQRVQQLASNGSLASTLAGNRASAAASARQLPVTTEPVRTALAQNSPVIVQPTTTRFYDACVKLRNAKVTPPDGDGYFSHHYEMIYAKYLDHLPENTPLRILELGLGCNMPAEWGGVGNSFKLWRMLFPRAQISFVEYDKDCAEEFRAAIEETGGRLFVGSQDDSAVIQAAVEASKPLGYDVIIDDAGHHPHHQKTSLLGLWPALRPGGVYILEDLLTSYFTQYAKVAFDGNAVVPFIQDMVHQLNCHTAMPELTDTKWKEYCNTQPPLLGKSMMWMECAPEICAFVKHRLPIPKGWQS